MQSIDQLIALSRPVRQRQTGQDYLIDRSIFLSIYYLSIYLSVSIYLYLSIFYLSIYLAISLRLVSEPPSLPLSSSLPSSIVKLTYKATIEFVILYPLSCPFFVLQHGSIDSYLIKT